MERFCAAIYEFLNPALAAPVIVPARLPQRFAINFVPAVSPVIVSSPVIASSAIASPVSPGFVSSTVYSVISSANFVNNPVLFMHWPARYVCKQCEGKRKVQYYA